MESDWHVVLVDALGGRERGLKGIGLLQFIGRPGESTSPGRSDLRTEELKKRNRAGSPTTRPISSDGTSASVPSSMPIGTTHNARNGRGAAGHGQPGRLDADVIRPGRAAADPHAAAVLGPAVVGCAAGHRVVEVVPAFEHSRRPRSPGNRLAEHLQQPSRRSFRLEDAAVEQHVRRPHRLARRRAVGLQETRPGAA